MRALAIGSWQQHRHTDRISINAVMSTTQQYPARATVMTAARWTCDYKPWSLNDLVIAVAFLLQPDHPIRKT